LFQAGLSIKLRVNIKLEKASHGDNLVDNLWALTLQTCPTVDNSGFSVDNPAGTVYKTPPNLWKMWGFRALNLWIVCG
jgi:hypothetical protein